MESFSNVKGFPINSCLLWNIKLNLMTGKLAAEKHTHFDCCFEGSLYHPRLQARGNMHRTSEAGGGRGILRFHRHPLLSIISNFPTAVEHITAFDARKTIFSKTHKVIFPSRGWWCWWRYSSCSDDQRKHRWGTHSGKSFRIYAFTRFWYNL